MLKLSKQPTFDESIATLRGYKFDVSSPVAVAGSVAKASYPSGSMQVAKYGCAAVLAPTKGAPATIVVKPGVLIQGEIGHILDKGYQKFIKTSSVERAATAEHLRAMHKFSEELRQAIGGISLYNESMGSVSDEYMYDRVKGRTTPESQRPTPAWELPVAPGTPGK